LIKQVANRVYFAGSELVLVRLEDLSHNPLLYVLARSAESLALSGVCLGNQRRNYVLISEEHSCEPEKGISRLFLDGDSYVRHVYQAFVLTLTGNYKDGASQPGIYFYIFIIITNN
jgi:hypothetical protein